MLQVHEILRIAADRTIHQIIEKGAMRAALDTTRLSTVPYKAFSATT